jgi:large subunit ribosomal protein L23
MALFSRNTKGKKEVSEARAKGAASQSSKKDGEDKTVSPRSLLAPTILIRPHVTEKAAVLTDSNVYAFVVSPNATKNEIRKAVEAVYKKTPERVAIVHERGKKVMRRAGEGRKPGFKKAYVYLKKGETINIL